MDEFLAAWKRYFTFTALLSCFINILQLTFTFYMFTIYRNVVISYSGFSLETITAAALFCLVFLGIFFYLRSRLLTAAGNRLHTLFRRRVLAGTIDTTAVMGDMAYRQGIADLNLLRDFFSKNTICTLFDLPWAPFFLILIFFVHPVLGLVSVTGAAFVVGLNILQDRLIRSSMADANKWNSRNQSFVGAFLRNTEVINGMGMSEAVADWFDVSHGKVLLNQTRSSRIAGTIQAVMKPVQNTIQVMIYCLGAFFVVTSGFSAGLMVAASVIMGRGLGPLLQASAAWKSIIQVKGAYDRLRRFEGALSNMTEKMALPEPDGAFYLDRAVFQTNGNLLLANITFSLEPGEFMGVIGPSGAGKTTLCKLMLGILPCSAGKVLLDGMPSFSWDHEAMGHRIGYLPQEVELFPGTLAENIARLGPVDREKVEKAASLCGLQNLVQALPQGYDTFLEGEGGIRFSGGQKQLVGLAMALYGDPSVLVLDEPTSNLDESAEALVVYALARLKQAGSTTCIMVTHKPSLLNSMDKILVLRQGQMLMFGPREAVFAKLAGLQAPAGKGAV